MQLEARTPTDSRTIVTHLVMMDDCNHLHNLFGGKLMAWMDIACGITAYKHSSQTCVTASIQNMTFTRPVPLGSIVTIEAKVTRAFSTSMEIMAEVWAEGENSPCDRVNQGVFIFVALDKEKKKVEIPPILPQTEVEKQRYEDALHRKNISLVLAGKTELKDTDVVNYLSHKKER